MNTIFGNLDKSKVPYGILRDYAMEFTELNVFNGTASLVDSNFVFANSYWAVYNTLSSARLNTASNFLKRADSLDLLWYQSLKPDTIVLTGLYVLYSQFKDNAYPDFLTVNNDQIYDKYVNNVWQNPYQTERVFVISPPETYYKDTLSFKILLPSPLWQANATYNNLSIDVADGLGYRTLTPGSVITITYPSSGLKEWKYRLQETGGTYLYAHSILSIGRPTIY